MQAKPDQPWPRPPPSGSRCDRSGQPAAAPPRPAPVCSEEDAPFSQVREGAEGPRPQDSLPVSLPLSPFRTGVPGSGHRTRGEGTSWAVRNLETLLLFPILRRFLSLVFKNPGQLSWVRSGEKEHRHLVGPSGSQTFSTLKRWDGEKRRPTGSARRGRPRGEGDPAVSGVGWGMPRAGGLSPPVSGGKLAHQ